MARPDEPGHGVRRSGPRHGAPGVGRQAGAGSIASANRDPGNRRRILIALGLVGALGLVAIAGASTFRATRFRDRLPSLPAWSREPAALRARLTEADRAARAAPTSADAVGALGFAYHANLFFAQADKSY